MNILNSFVLLATESNYSIADKVNIGLLGTISGMLIVFLALIVISIMLGRFKHLNKPKKQVVVEEPKPVVEAVPVETPQEEQDDLELVAVITAAIAASLGTSSDRLRVKSLRRVATRKSGWNTNRR